MAGPSKILPVAVLKCHECVRVPSKIVLIRVSTRESGVQLVQTDINGVHWTHGKRASV